MFERLHNGEVSNYTRLGGYPIFYSSKHPQHTFGSHIFCPSCALTLCTEEEEVEETDFLSHINFENPHLSCDVCDHLIETAYE